MKIKTIKDVEKLDAKIEKELGIDVKKYKNEKIANSFVELLVFPTYVSLCLIRTILASLGIFIIGFFVVDLVHVEYVIYGLIGFILFLAIGIQIGILILSWKIKSDIYYIVKFTLEITESALTDINKINSKITKVNRKEVFGLLFKGIIHIVTIPTLSKVIIDKVPFVAGLVNKIVKRVLILVTEKIKFSSEELEHNVMKNKSQLNAIQTNTSPITSISTGLEKVMNFTFGIVQLPLKITSVILIIILILFVLIIN